MGVAVLPPDLRLSDVDVAINGKDIFFGLSNIKGIGKGTARYITKMVRQHDCYSRSDLERALALEQSEWELRKKAHNTDNPMPFKERSPKSNLRSNVIELLERIGAFDAYVAREVTLPQMQQAEKELLGIILSDNTEEAFRANQDLLDDCDTYADLYESESDVYTRLPGIITSVRQTKTRANGTEMGIVNIEYGMDRIEFVVFPQQWKAYKWLWKERTPGIFKLKRTDRGINFEEGMRLG